MFQFRAFPSHTYFIQCVILEYCSSVLPHSEISGSMLICSSPKLIAACRVLHRLLMPRHSPCALISLTSSICFRISPHLTESPPLGTVQTIGSLRIMQASKSSLAHCFYPFFTKQFSPFGSKFHNFAVLLSVACFTSTQFTLCSVFKVHSDLMSDLKT